MVRVKAVMIMAIKRCSSQFLNGLTVTQCHIDLAHMVMPSGRKSSSKISLRNTHCHWFRVTVHSYQVHCSTLSGFQLVFMQLSTL